MRVCIIPSDASHKLALAIAALTIALSTTLKGAESPARAPRTPVLVEVTLNGRPLADFHDMYTAPNQRQWLPIEAIVRAGEGSVASEHAGHYRFTLGEGRPVIEVDTTNQTLVVDENRVNWRGDELMTKDGLLYADATLIEQWYGISANLGDERLNLALESERPLPVDLRMLREQRWRNFEQPDAATTKRYRALEYPYRSWGNPRATVQLSTSASNASSELPLSASGTLNVEAGYLSNRIFYSADDDDGLKTLRWRGGRDSVDGEVFGISGLHRLHFGDVSGLRIPLTSRGDQGRGLRFSTAPRSRAELFDVIRIEGDALLGWEAELYRGSELIDFQSVSDDGRYDFEDVPLGYGANPFRVVLYGPSGQIEERIVERTIPQSQLRTGELSLRGSAVQAGRSMVNLDRQSHTDGYQLDLRADYGLFPRLTTSGIVRVAKDPQDTLDSGDSKVRRTTAGVVLQPNLGALRTELVGLRQRQGGSAQQLDVRLPLTNTAGVSANYRHYSDQFLTTRRELSGGLIERRYTVRGRQQLGRMGGFEFGSLGIAYTHNQFQQNPALDEYDVKWRHPIGNIRIAHTLSQTRQAANRSTNYRLLGSYRNGDLTARGRLRADGPRANALSVSNIGASLSVDLNENRRITGNADHNVLSSNESFGLSLSQGIDAGRIGVSTNMSNSGDWSLGFRINLGLGLSHPDHPRLIPPHTANTGALAISARVDDRPLEGIGFKVNGRQHPARTNDAGEVVIGGLPVHRESRIALDRDTMVDPFLTPLSPRISLVPRRGSTHAVDMPFADAASASGHARRADDSPLQGVEIVAERTDGMDRVATRSLSDGYFAFDVLSPGQWQIQVSPDEIPDDWITPAVKLELDPGEQHFDILVTARRSAPSSEPIQRTRVDTRRNQPAASTTATTTNPSYITILGEPAPSSLEQIPDTAVSPPLTESEQTQEDGAPAAENTRTDSEASAVSVTNL